MVQKWEYCSLQLEQKMGYKPSSSQVYRGVKVEEEPEPVWEVHCTLRLPGGELHKRVFEPGSNFVDELNELGKEGWELSGVVDEKSGIIADAQATASSSWLIKSFIFRRPIG